MGKHTASFFQKQEKKEQKTFLDPYPDYSLDRIIPVKLVGYARVLSQKAIQDKSHTISVSDKYLTKVWHCTPRTVSRKLKELEHYGIFFRLTSDYRPGVGMFRVIVLKPLAQSTHNRQVKHQTKMSDHKDTIALQLDRTIQRRVESPTSSQFIPLGELKETDAKKKRKPNKKIRELQLKFLKSAIEKITEKDELDYRFMCLILRNVLGAESPTIAHYGEKLHMKIRYKPESVLAVLDLMQSTYSSIKCPIAWLVSELQSLVGIKSPRNQPAADRTQHPPPQQDRKPIKNLSVEGERALKRFRAINLEQHRI